MLQLTCLCRGVYKNEGVQVGPKTIEYEGRILYRFMDRFYIRCVTEKLTPDEVRELCRARARSPEVVGAADREVQALFRAFVNRRQPARLLEVGAGMNPILRPEDLAAGERPMLYVGCDADPATTAGRTLFSGSNPRLPYEPDFFQMVVAVFVLHFHLFVEQIDEIKRCLTPSGVFVANVYRRTNSSMTRLASSFTDGGLFVRRLADPRSLCDGHEYWAISKDPAVALGAVSELAALARELAT